MYFPDNHVTGMLWCMKEHSVDNSITEYRIPNNLNNGGGTVIKGEWINYVRKNGEHNMSFLIHSWENEVDITREEL